MEQFMVLLELEVETQLLQDSVIILVEHVEEVHLE